MLAVVVNLACACRSSRAASPSAPACCGGGAAALGAQGVRYFVDQTLRPIHHADFEGFSTTDSGLQYKIVEGWREPAAGRHQGPLPGYLLNGEKFELRTTAARRSRSPSAPAA